ncbi:hypothetical protein BGW36DRAFT_168637 [Talaromyces proteolyticus]|uniref:Uncharacterized protein n=1 Tax=Talaromyces proteolyticus TaxID=1131652 RepID=A0AAD4KR65_9EURO|nr:uncharacterized protein BGW36DRAFT_168637 [Talaromyces proteolyticus]KAH8697490.1 hypothetical protein BGW36DRAFT_168637 [Talaromyces proteolyticus]
MASSLLSGIYHLYDLFQAIRGANPTFLTPHHVPGTDLTGKWIIISGSNSGIGLEAAKSFATWGANLILACREPASWELHPTAAVQECKFLADAHGHSRSVIEWWEIDMADLASVEAFCRRWLDSGRGLDVLCNNAGVVSTSKTHMTRDGFQLVHQVNFLSHVLLTLRLLPSLARSPEPRVICTTSCVHHLGELDLEHFNCGPDMHGGDYGNNKLYFQMWVSELQSRFLKHREYMHITINGVHPGYVVTGIWKSVNEAEDTSGRWLKTLSRYIGITAQQGSLAITHAATSPELGPDPKTQSVGVVGGGGGGRYINRIWEAAPKFYCHDLQARKRLWVKLDEELQLREKGLLTILGL